MRVALVAPPWVAVPPPAYGGIEMVVDHLARGLVAQGHDVLLHASGDSTCPVPLTSTGTVPAGAVGPGAAAAELAHVVAGYEEIFEWGPDIVHDHTLAGPLYGYSGPVPVITTNHGPFGGPMAGFYQAVAQLVPVVAISHHQATTARGTPIAAVIHHGIDTEAIAEGPGGGGYALFLGRMSPDKGVDVAVRVARRAGVPLRIACRLSEPAEHEFFRRAVEPHLGGAIRYVGEVGGEEKAELIARASCLLNPVMWPEPFGMVMIEAMAHGTPVVATPCGSVPELVEEGVTGFVRSSEAELADAMRAAPALDRGRVRATAARRFSTRRMVDDHVRAYERALRVYERGLAHGAPRQVVRPAS